MGKLQASSNVMVVWGVCGGGGGMCRKDWYVEELNWGRCR